MPKLLDRGVLTDDTWQLIEDPDGAAVSAAPEQAILVSRSVWEDRHTSLRGHSGPIGLWLDVDTEAEDLARVLDDVPLIAIRFPAFTDGRGLSLAVLLRTRLGFAGELRAIGAVHEDIVHYMDRCGFDTYSLADNRNHAAALRATASSSGHYQGSVREPEPVFRRVQRA
jgi:uncharacterized protein (DUF934 family)